LSVHSYYLNLKKIIGTDRLSACDDSIICQGFQPGGYMNFIYWL
jgi:hypothetical protein